MPTYRNTINTIDRLRTPQDPPNFFGVFISFSKGRITPMAVITKIIVTYTEKTLQSVF